MEKLSIPAKLGYGAGGMAFSVKDVAFGTFVLFYYTQVVGLSGTATGIALFIAMSWDAVSDPMIGSFSDNFRSKWGRRHPFMALGGIPYALTFLALFNPPMHWGTTGKFWWFLITCLLVRTFLTMFSIPHTSLAVELSDDYQERSSIIGFRTVQGWINGTLLAFIVWRFFMVPGQTADGQPIDGRLIADNYRGYAVLSCILVVILTSIATASTAKFIPRLRTATTDVKRFSFFQVFRDFKWALTNRNFRILCLMMFSQSTAAGVGVALGLFISTYFWELSTAQLAYISFVAMGASIFTFSLLGPLGRRFDKHRLIQACYILGVANGFWLIGSRLLGILPENGHPLIYPLWLLSAFIGTCFGVLGGIMVSSFTADIVDEHELNTGLRQEGVFYAVEAFAGKAVSGIGTMVGGFVLDFVKFPHGAAPGTVPDDVLFKLGVIGGPVLSCVWLIPLGLSLLLNLDRKRCAEIKEALAQRYEDEASTP